MPGPGAGCVIWGGGAAAGRQARRCTHLCGADVETQARLHLSWDVCITWAEPCSVRRRLQLRFPGRGERGQHLGRTSDPWARTARPPGSRPGPADSASARRRQRGPGLDVQAQPAQRGARGKQQQHPGAATQRAHPSRPACCNLLVSPCAAGQVTSPKALACMDAHFWWGRYCCVPLRAKRAWRHWRPEGVRPAVRGCQAGDQPQQRVALPLAATHSHANLFHHSMSAVPRRSSGSARGPPWPTSANKGAGALAHIRKQPPLQPGCTHGSTAPRTCAATSPSVQPATFTASGEVCHMRLPAASSGSGGSTRCRMSMAMGSLWGMPWRRGRPAGGEGVAAGGGQRVGDALAPGQACGWRGSCGGGWAACGECLGAGAGLLAERVVRRGGGRRMWEEAG